jgi:hypothetical protein
MNDFPFSDDAQVASNTEAIATNASNIATNASNILVSEQALANLDGEVVKKTGNQTIAGVKTFSDFPAKSGSGTALNPSSDGEFATKKYVDDNTGATTFYGFSAYASSDDTVAAGDAMLFDDPEENDGNLSNTSGSKYTVVKKGFYFIHAQVYTSSNNAYPWIQIVNTSGVTNLAGIYQDVGGLTNSNCACVAELEVDDEIYVTPRTSGFKLLGRAGQNPTQGIFSNFSAFIITET